MLPESRRGHSRPSGSRAGWPRECVLDREPRVESPSLRRGGLRLPAFPRSSGSGARVRRRRQSDRARARARARWALDCLLDGENAWGSYPDDGRPFLHAPYAALAAGPEIKTVTIAEYLDVNTDRQIAAHPLANQPGAWQLFTGSWIDEAGSTSGVDLGTWIGEPQENRAWELLGAVRDRIEEAGVTPHRTRRPFARSTLPRAATGSGGSRRTKNLNQTPLSMPRSAATFARLAD